MKRLTVVMVLLMSMVLISGVAFADGTNEFLKGNDPDDPLEITLGIAKIIEVENSPIESVRIQLDRQSDIGNISNATYNISCILEF